MVVGNWKGVYIPFLVVLGLNFSPTHSNWAHHLGSILKQVGSLVDCMGPFATPSQVYVLSLYKVLKIGSIIELKKLSVHGSLIKPVIEPVT